jgi:hypothetical protein
MGRFLFPAGTEPAAGTFTVFTHFGGVPQNELLNAAFELVFILLLFGS